MIKNYNLFLNNNLITEANVKNMITRDDLKIGDSVMTMGEHDGVNLDYQVGKIIEMKEYGYILIEFDEPFSKKFHAGHMNIGKPNHCFYVSLNNISTNDREEFEKIIKEIGDAKKNRAARLNIEYNEGDIIVALGKTKIYNNEITLDGEVGIVYYEIQKGGLNEEDKYEKNNAIYWVGFLDKFSPRNMEKDNDNLPHNGAGMIIDKIHMRLATEEEIERLENKLKPFKKQIEELKQTYEIGDVVVASGNYQGLDLGDNLGIVMEASNSGGYGYGNRSGRKQYSIQFLSHFHGYLYNINDIMTNDNGYVLPKSFLRLATEEEKEKHKTQIESIKKEIDEFNHDYKNGEYVITSGNFDGLTFDGQIGIIRGVTGQKPRDTFDVEFMGRFNERLYKIGKHENCYRLQRRFLSPAVGIDVEELRRKLEAREIAPFRTSPPLAMLLNRIGLKLKNPFMSNTYFDITDTNDMISYLPIRRWDGKEDPYKSRLRQPVKAGKFFRMLDKNLTDKEVETLVNGFKGAFDICIKKISDKLKLVSGEDVRYWYNGERYVQGGGRLNSSCMRNPSKGPEMQMFVDNPDVIQLLILTDEENKLLGRALIWRLAKPPGQTYMDYIYTRYDKDYEIFTMYAEQRGWISADIAYGRNGGRSRGLPNMVCALNTNKEYRQGRNALDHFDTFHLVSSGNFLTNGYDHWKRPNPIPEKPEEEKPGKFAKGERIKYQRAGAANDGKVGVFFGEREDGKYKLIFDDGVKFAAAARHVFPEKGN